MNLQTSLITAAAVLFAVFLALGVYVSARPLGALDAKAVRLRGHATWLAVLFTRSGRGRGVTALCIVSFVLFAIAHWTLWIPLAMMISQILSQGAVELAKARYVRTRPDYWLVGLEAGHSYPSGHATTAVVFFCGWAIVALFSTLAPPVRYAVAALLVLWAGGVSWSRLSLGAHYASDVLGGTAFGTAWLCAAATVVQLSLHVP